MSELLNDIFYRKNDATNRERAKFLSRVFGIFSERIVSYWAADPRAPYQDLGRPTLKMAQIDKGYTLDFALKERSTGNIYVSEMKCEIEYQNFRYFILSDVGQLEHHKKPAFDAFLRAARPTVDLFAYVQGKPTSIRGAVLIWGAITPDGRRTAMAEKGFHDVLSIDSMCRDLASWGCREYGSLLEERRIWCNELFDGLLGKPPN